MTAQECRSVTKFAGEQTNNLRALRAAVEGFIKVRGIDGRQGDEEQAFQELCMTLAEQYPKDTADA